MTVRSATLDDLAALEELWRAFEAEVPPPAHEEVDLATELAEIRAIVESGLGWLAEKDGAAVGMALARRRGPRVGRITDLYVRPAARRAGVAEALTRAVVGAVRRRRRRHGRPRGDGVEHRRARRLRALGLPRRGARARGAGGGARRAARRATVAATSFGSIHAQTDDVDVIVKAVEMFVPRLPGRSAGSIVTQPRGGYVTVYDDVCDRDPAMLRRLAKEISSRTGLVVIALGVEEEARRPDDPVRPRRDRRRVRVGARVPRAAASGRGVALHANPVVVERYTGAPQAAVRAAAPVAGVPADLPPARELLAGLAGALGLSGAEHGWADAPGGRRRDQDRPLMLKLDRRPPLPLLRARPDRARREGRSRTRRS